MKNKYSTKSVRKAEVDRLLKNGDRSLSTDLSARFGEGKVYVHPNGQILYVFLNGRAVLYETTDDFMRLIVDYEALKTASPKHLLNGRFPYDMNFPDSVEGLVLSLKQNFPLASSKLDFTVDSLNELESVIYQYGRTPSLEVPMFPMLVAYVGKVMIDEVDGQWSMRLGLDNQTWEPWVIDAEARSCNPFIVVYDELAEQHPFSIVGAVTAEIKVRRAR